jgi:hypothetical protein
MDISKMLTRTFSIFFGLTILLFAASLTMAQTDSTPKKRLNIPATVKGFIGGESHAGYVVRAQKGQRLTVQISWQSEDNNKAEFTIKRSADFFNGEPVKFGRETYDGKIWSGKIPTTGNYYIYVIAHPSAKYTLKVNRF